MATTHTNIWLLHSTSTTPTIPATKNSCHLFPYHHTPALPALSHAYSVSVVSMHNTWLLHFTPHRYYLLQHLAAVLHHTCITTIIACCSSTPHLYCQPQHKAATHSYTTPALLTATRGSPLGCTCITYHNTWLLYAALVHNIPQPMAAVLYHSCTSHHSLWLLLCTTAVPISL